ncbi:MAG: winged helix-turn-helix transcriptional regulator [Erysipelotrichaceae bacterium]|nr:winged helix-turn-helix transcriptional regulator [Erysipelotrichaceae bacterium]
MTKREKAVRLMEEIKKKRPVPLLEHIDRGERGINFILAYLDSHRDKEVIAADLAKELGVSTARVSVLLKKLKDKALIKTFASARDARKAVVELTEKGEKTAKENLEKLIKAHEKLLDELSDKEIETFLRISGKMQMIMDETLKEGGKDESI